MLLQDNLVIQRENTILLFNLFNFKSVEITKSEFEDLESHIKSHIKSDGNNKSEVYERLVSEKQFLSSWERKVFDIETDKAYKNFWEERKDGLLPIASIHIEITDCCNLKCEYCYQREKVKHCTLKPEDIWKIKELCENYNQKLGYTDAIKSVSISGGETLLENNIAIINQIAEVFPNASLNLFTNGINVTKYWDRIPIDRIARVSMSLDGKDEVISKLSGTTLSVYENIIGGIEKILQEKIKLRLSVAITKDTVANMDSLFEDLEKRQMLRNENIEVLVYPIQDYETKNALSNTTYQSEDEFFGLVKMISDTIRPYDNIFISAGPDLGRLLNVIGGGTKLRFNRCVNGVMSVTVGPDGKVYFCSDFAGERAVIADINQELTFDNEKIKWFLGDSITKNEQCKNCMYRNVCLGGCRLRALARGVGSNESGFYCGAYTNDKFIENLGLFI